MNLSERLTLFTLLSVLLLGCEKTAPIARIEEPTKVRVLTVEPETIQPTLEFTGSVVSRTVALVHPEVSGTLVEVAAREGSEVKAGETLARIDPEDFRLELLIAQSERQKAQAEYERIVRGYRPEEIRSQRASHENAKALLSVQESNLERNRNLREAGTMTERDWTVFLAETDAARAMVEKSSAELAKMVRGYEDYDLRSASATVALAQAREDLASRKLRQTAIVSPVDGIVAFRRAEVGQLVGAADRLFEVRDPNSVWLLADASMIDAVEICVGQKAELHSAVGENSAKGFVDRIGRTLDDRTRSMPIWFAWSPGAPLPPVGSFAKATVFLAPIEQTILLRREWVQVADGEHFVWLVEEGKLKRSLVAIGEDEGDRVSIATGLETGMQVVVSPATADFEEGLPVVTEGFRPPDREENSTVETISLSSLDSN